MSSAEVLRWEEFPRRTIHLDFHTSPQIPDVGVDFDADAFARTFKDAHVDSVTVFAKCHHGRLYFDTDRPERHPGLDRGLDLMGEQIKALHGAGIKAPIYVSIQCDEYAADLHQDWVALTAELVQVRHPMTDAYHASWQTLDMSSPYQEFVAGQIEEILGRYGPVDGMFLDMCWDQPSSSRWAIAGMKRDGLDPASAEDRAKYARSVAHRYMERFSTMIAAHLHPGSSMAVWFNSRPKAGLNTEAKYLRHIEVESLPTGGWGYNYLPYVGRLVRSFGLPMVSQTGRFHRSWGDMASLKPEAALRYECGQILMHGLSLGVGDLLPPNAVPNPAAYDRIRTVYSHIEACEPFVAGGRNRAEMALVVDAGLGDAPGPAVIGAMRVLQQLRHQFDVVPIEAALASYPVVIVPDSTPIGADLAARLRAHVDQGGSLVLSTAAAAASADGTDLLRALGWRIVGKAPYTTTFLRLSPSKWLTPPVPEDVRIHGESFLVDGIAASETLVELVYPYFERAYDHFSGHSYTPPQRPSGHGAVVQNGRVIVFAVPLLAGVAEEGNDQYRQLVGECLDRLVPAPLLRTSGPVHLETSVVETDRATSVHLLSFVPARLAHDLDLVYDPFPIVDIDVALRLEAAPTRVTLQPRGEELSSSYEDGYASTRATVLDGHAVLVFEK
jgi:Hypothetical glycosyl hydrolase 6/Beta-galactosidase trimerisation domain